MSERSASLAVKPASSTVARAMLLQRKCACGTHAPNGGECDGCARNRMQRKSSGVKGTAAIPQIVHTVLGTAGKPLEGGTRALMEQRFGHDFSSVRIHSDAPAGRSADAVGALAYTVGQDIVFARHQYAPNTNEGRQLVAHELTHVVQQAGDDPGATDSSTAEAEAEAIGQSISSATHVVVGRSTQGNQLQRQPKPKRSIDASAQAIIDAAQDDKTTPDIGKRATAAVESILKTYYPGEAAKVSDVIYEEKEPGLSTTPVGSGSNLTGKIFVGKAFVEQISSFARRVLQVGHELQHVDQQRAGMGGGQNLNKREFLAFAWEALQQPKPGTGRLAYAMSRDLVDCALGYLYCLSGDEQKANDSKKAELLKKRDEVNGKGGNPSTEPPTTCKPCESPSKAGGARKTEKTPSPPGKVTTQPAPTKLSAGDAQRAVDRKTDGDKETPKIELSAAAGGELETSGAGADYAGKLSFEASIPVASYLADGGLRTRPLLFGSPLKFFDELSLEPSVGFKPGDKTHQLLTPLAVEASLKMISVEWEKQTSAGLFKFGVGAAGKASLEYTPQTSETSVQAGAEFGGELEYRRNKDSAFFVKVEAKGQAKFEKKGGAEIQWQGASFDAEAKVGVNF